MQRERDMSSFSIWVLFAIRFRFGSTIMSPLIFDLSPDLAGSINEYSNTYMGVVILHAIGHSDEKDNPTTRGLNPKKN